MAKRKSTDCTTIPNSDHTFAVPRPLKRHRNTLPCTIGIYDILYSTVQPVVMSASMYRMPDNSVYVYALANGTTLLSVEHPTCWNYILMDSDDQPIKRQILKGSIAIQYQFYWGMYTVLYFCTACKSHVCSHCVKN